MSDFLTKIFSQIGSFMKDLTPAKKMAVGGTIGAMLVGMVSLFYWAGDKTFHNLFTNLNPEDAASIMRVLREKQIPFKVDQGGRNITVPPEYVDQLRLELAMNGQPQNSTVGYEVFDKQSLGTTSFVQKVNQKRALEGEIMRTIGTIHGVKRSRVHLALPQKSTFVEDQKKPTASVVLDLDNGVLLSEKQIYGIGNLVARAVEGMDVNDVVIVDAQGKMLSKTSNDPLAQASATQIDFRQKIEHEKEKMIEAMLARVVGDGHVVAKVSADVDFSQVNETQTLYDADGSAVRSVQKDTKSMEGSRPGPSGPAGVTSNTPGQPVTTAQGVKSDTKTSNETTNYEVPQTIRRTTKPSGQVKKLSVAVVMDTKKTKVPGKDGAASEFKSEAWSEEKMKEFESIISSAVGLDRKRGDTLELKSMEFTQEDFDEAAKQLAESERKSYIQSIVMYGVVGLTIILFFMLVVRPFIKWITENTVDSVETYLPQTIEELERLQKNTPLPGLEDAVPVLTDKIDPEKVEGEMIKEKIITLIDQNPHKAALILRDWLHGMAAKKTGGEDPKGAGKSKAG